MWLFGASLFVEVPTMVAKGAFRQVGTGSIVDVVQLILSSASIVLVYTRA
jgi:hypothetical protein